MARHIRCRVCGEKPIAKIHYARMYLCKDHYIEYIVDKVERTIRRYKLIKGGHKVLACVSGGKDSLTMLDCLARLKDKLKFKLIVLHVDLGLGEYSKVSREGVVKVSEDLNLPLIIVEVYKILDTTIPELARKVRRPPCSVCGIIKRYITNATAVELGADVLALGHNLDDITSYALKEFLNQNLGYIGKLGPSTEGVDGLAVGRVRPLYEVYEREALIYAIALNLPFTKVKCPYANFDSLENYIKAKMNELELEFPGIKLMFARNLARNISNYPEIEAKLTNCEYCGLISSTRVCAYCRITEKALGKPAGPLTRDYVRELVRKSCRST